MSEMIKQQRSEHNKRNNPPEKTEMKRTFSLNIRTNGILDVENRIIEVSFSSEEPVSRWFGKEVLLHTKEAVDLEPIKNVGSILLNHNPDNPVAKPLNVWLDEGDKKGRATIQFGDTELGKKTFEEVRQGLIRGVSVGYIVDKWRLLEADEEYEGFVGPLDIATKWRVLEFSLTPVPADASVGIGRTVDMDNIGNDNPKKEEDKNMDKKENPVQEQGAQERKVEQPAAVDIEAIKREAEKAERGRVLEIRSLCKKFEMDDFAEELIKNGTDLARAKDAILERLASKPENEPVTDTAERRIEMGTSAREKVRDAMIAGLEARAGLSEEVNEFTGMTLFELARKSLETAHISTVGSSMDIIGRAITTTTSDFPIVLQNIANKSVLQGFNEEPETWSNWCNTGSVSDFNVHTGVAAGEIGDIEEIKEGAKYKHIDYAGEIQEQYSVAKYGGIFSLTREAIKNDDLGLITTRARNIGITAQRKIADLAYSVLIDNPKMGDNVNLFASTHKNLASSGAAIGYDSLKDAINAMLAQKDTRGKRRLTIKPQFLILPASLEMDAQELLGMQYIDYQAGKPNVLRKYNLNIVCEGRLDDAGTAWYLAGPKGKTVTIFFLDGKQTPTLETKQGFDVDGIEYKVRIEAGAKAMSWKALYKNPGV